MSSLTYQDFELLNYVNSRVAVRLRAIKQGQVIILELPVTDLLKASVVGCLNLLAISDTGEGKSQLLRDISRNYFGGDGPGGNSNLAEGNSDFDIADLFEFTDADLSSGRFDSRTARKVDEDRIRRLFNGVDELNRAPTFVQNRFYSFAEGDYTFRGVKSALGAQGYSLFWATMNLNGDFLGTSDTDRALLNRAHIILDLDHFDSTCHDEITLERRSKVSPRMDLAPLRDISDKILEAHAKVSQMASTFDPYFLAFRLLIGKNGLGYCAKDPYHKKNGRFPMLCSDCDSPSKDLCSRIKSCSPRTVTAVKKLAYSLAYIVQLKYGPDVDVDIFSAALQALRFTTYHGNLNELIAQDSYSGRKQTMMDETASLLEPILTDLRDLYLPNIQNGIDPRFLVFDGNKIVQDTPQLRTILDQSNVPYVLHDLKEDLEAKGLGSDWVDEFVKEIK